METPRTHRVGVSFGHAKNKRRRSSFYLDSNVDVVLTSWQRSESFINAPGAPLVRGEIVVQTPFARRWYGVHRDLTAFSPRSYDASMALLGRVINLTTPLWQL